MKMSRFFILIGVCTLATSLLLMVVDSALGPATAEALPILRADPRAGDPDEPSGGFHMPVDDWGVDASMPAAELQPSFSQQDTKSLGDSWRAMLRDYLLSAWFFSGMR